MSRFTKIIFAVFAVAMMCSFNAEAGARITGRITNSVTGKGIARVPVTDGYSYVKTDARGKYTINPDPRAVKIYYSLPAEYQVNLDAENHRPVFYSLDSTLQGVKKVDFQLTPLKSGAEKDFSLIVIGDPQCKSAKNADRFTNETMPDVVATANSCPGVVYALTLGDITFDNTKIWDRMAKSMSNVAFNGGYLPIYQCIGNHDHDSLVENTDDDDDDDNRACGAFVNTFGPTDYSFNRGDVHIVVMDDIMVDTLKSSTKPNKLTWHYSGGLTDDQYEWLKQDLACVENPSEKMLLFCVHIPFYGSVTKTDKHMNEALELMKGFKECHILSGHTHTQFNTIYKNYVTLGGTPVYEHVHGTACGSWWVNNTNLCGSPCGYNVYSVSGPNVTSWRFKGTNRDAAYQMRIYDGNQTYTGEKGLEYRWYETTKDSSGGVTAGFKEAKDALVAEVFDDDADNWKLEMWIDGAKAGEFIHKTKRLSNVALAAFYHNVQGRKGGYWNGKNTQHYWYFTMPEGLTAADLENGSHTWEVRAIFTVPTNKSKVLTYTCSHITRDYSEF